jgi:hypothetical protein
MVLSLGDLRVGDVAYFVIDDLRADPEIRFTGGSPDGRPRPFVCYSVDSAGCSYWTPLTTQTTQGKRALIRPEWIVRASGRLATDLVLVNDGGHTYAGCPTVFARLSTKHDRFSTATRPQLTTEGVAEVVGVVRARGGILPPECPDRNADLQA